MKIHLLLLLTALFLLNNCTTVRSTSSGMDNVAYIVLVSNNSASYPSPLDISIGETLQVKASVIDENKRVPANAIISIPSGQYNVTVKQGTQILFSQVLRLDNQQTRRIQLP